MPEDGSKLADVGVLADAAAQVDLRVPLAGLARLTPLLASATGDASGHVRFSRDRGHIVAAVAASADLEVVCQRCLSRFTLPTAGESRVALIASEAEADRLPPDLESALAAEGRMRLRELIEEELLLALPAAPMHRQGECGTESAAVAPSAGPTQRPFAALGELLDGGRKNQLES